MIKEFLHTSEKERQTQAELLDIEKREEMEILSRSYSEQSLHRTKDTLCKSLRKTKLYTLIKNVLIVLPNICIHSGNERTT